MSLTTRAFRITALGIAVAGATPVVFLFGILAIQTVPAVFNPCVWFSFDGQVQDRPRPPQSCHGVRGIPEDRLTYIIQSMGMPTILLLLGVLGISGAAYSHRAAILSVSGIFLLLTIPLMLGSFGIVTLISAICFFISALLTKTERDRTARSQGA